MLKILRLAMNAVLRLFGATGTKAPSSDYWAHGL